MRQQFFNAWTQLLPLLSPRACVSIQMGIGQLPPCPPVFGISPHTASQQQISPPVSVDSIYLCVKQLFQLIVTRLLGRPFSGQMEGRACSIAPGDQLEQLPARLHVPRMPSRPFFAKPDRRIQLAAHAVKL